jgi:hypothetical protein
MRLVAPSRDTIAVTTPLRPSIAAAVAFPSGSIMASGLGREEHRRLIPESNPLSHGAE